MVNLMMYPKPPKRQKREPKGLRRSTPLKTNTRLGSKNIGRARRSNLRRSKYDALSREFKDENPICQVRVSCFGMPTSDVHHLKGRGIYLLVVETWRACCTKCHRFIHRNPAKAYELGLLWKRNQLEEDAELVARDYEED